MQEQLTADRILDAAQDVLRRYGPGKATVVDVARALGVSHGSVYRHFPSKAALRDAVADRWLRGMSAPLAAVAGEGGPAVARLRRWFDLLRATKRAKAHDDPEMFATYCALTAEARDVVAGHVEELIGQIARMVADGMAAGELRRGDAQSVAQALFHATTRFHNPVHAECWSDTATDAAFEAVWDVLLHGIAA